MNQVDFLGIHVLETHNIGQRVDVAGFVKSKFGKVVIVTKVKEIPQIFKIIDIYNPFGLQLHYYPDKNIIEKIKLTYPKLKIFAVVTDEQVFNFSDLDNLVDYYIYDTSYQGGTGIENSLKLLNNLSSEVKAKTLLAGGMNMSRVISLSQTDIAGFDVQSYFRESEQFYYNRLEKMASYLKNSTCSKISVSLSHLNTTNIVNVPPFYGTFNIEYHLDYSDGSLYPGYIIPESDFKIKITLLKNKPLSLHFFVKDKSKISNILKGTCGNFMGNITRIFIQYDPKSNIEFENLERDISIIPVVYYQDLEYFFTSAKVSTLDNLAIGLPSKGKNNLNQIVQILNLHATKLINCQIWFDRDIDSERIKFFKQNLKLPFNLIIGKEVTEDWKNLDVFYEQFII